MLLLLTYINETWKVILNAFFLEFEKIHGIAENNFQTLLCEIILVDPNNGRRSNGLLVRNLKRESRG